MNENTEQFDRRLLGRLEAAVPLVREPYDLLAKELGCLRQTVLDRLERLRGPEGIIREIAGIFDAAALGYHQSLVAMKVPPPQLDGAGKRAAGHPGVSHCYGREGHFNLWLTLAVSPGSTLGFDRTVELLAKQCGAAAVMSLPVLRKYKLRVRLAGADQPGDNEGESPASHTGPPPILTDAQIRAIRALQQDLPGREDPFAPLAEAVSMEADELLVHAADFLAAGWLRRYAAVLHHRAAGAKANVMVAWRAGGYDADVAGAVCRRIGAVSHCYLRQGAPGWPYSFYTMIHGRSRAECVETVEQVAIETGLADRVLLWTQREYKKQRVRLFSDAERTWESRHAE